MLMRVHFLIWKLLAYSVRIWFLFVIGLFSHVSMYAQEPPTITVTLVVVPEMEACKPHGYASYASGIPSKCETIRRSDIESWKDSDYTHMTQSLPPEEISLDTTIFLFLANYLRVPKNAPETRAAIVMLFDWEQPQFGSIELQREVPENQGIPIIDKTWSGELHGEHGWIHHERADAFVPSNNIRWILRLGEVQWTLKTIRAQ